MTHDWIIYGTIAVAGFLLGGVWTMWKTAKIGAMVLLAFAVLAAGAGVLWWLS